MIFSLDLIEDHRSCKAFEDSLPETIEARDGVGEASLNTILSCKSFLRILS